MRASLRFQRSWSRPAGAFLLATLPSPSLPAAAQADYTQVDRVEGEVSFNPVPRRPMVMTADQLHMYAVNTHNSTVLHFDDLTGDPSDVFHVPKSPVSIGLWSDGSTPADPERLVVVCDGTYALVILDRSSGTILQLLELRDPDSDRIMGEPGDLLIDQATSTAFVSCAAADAVLEIDLAGAPAEVVRKFDLPAKDPVFMCFDAGMNVLVAPMLSGNNSGARHSAEFIDTQHKGPTVVDFTTLPSGTRLPDRDLFRCVRSSGAVEAVTTGMGTVLFACGLHPSNQIWQLNTEANNKDPDAQTEELVRGNIVQNRLSIVDLSDPGLGPPPHAPTDVLELDLLHTPFDLGKTVGQPYGLSFAGTRGIITGLLTDNFLVLNQDGTVYGEQDLPAGSIPRATLYSSLLNMIYVYCWGTSKIEAHRLVTGLPYVRTHHLGYDPTPGPVQEGRRIFYDAANSEKNNASCASCHVEGRTDMVVWNLSKGAIDDKGPMLTQTLAGIEKYVPFHWRGEQQLGLIDFNPAFVKLLGAPASLSPADFALFERFVFSIQNRPNPFAGDARELDDSIQPPQLPFGPLTASAVNGQTLFDNPAVQPQCENCHHLPLGSSGDIIGDGALKGEENPRRQFFKIGPFHDLYKKEQDADKLTPHVQTISITMPGLDGGPDVTALYPLLGAGSSHAGLVLDLNQFVGAFNLPAQQIADLTAFIFQWDQGVAPAVYRGVLLDPTDTESAQDFDELIDQADERNCDVAVFGTHLVGGNPTPMRWYYDRSKVPTPLFIAEDEPLEQPRSYFEGLPPRSNVFIGLPVGSGRRFAIDFDGDDLFNRDEIAAGTDPNDPLDPPLQSDSVNPSVVAQTVMFTSRVARINIETSEPCTATVTYTRHGGSPQTKSTSEFVRTQSIVLNDLLRASVYDVVVDVEDRSGNPASTTLPDLTTRHGNGSNDVAVIGSLGWGLLTKHISSGSIIANVNVRVDKKLGGPPPIPLQGYRVIARILVNGNVNSTFGASLPSQKVSGFKFMSGTTPADFTGLAGPFLVSPATPDTPNPNTGLTSLKFSLSGLSPGDQVQLNIELVGPDASGQPFLTLSNIALWNMPATPANKRTIGLTF